MSRQKRQVVEQIRVRNQGIAQTFRSLIPYVANYKTDKLDEFLVCMKMLHKHIVAGRAEAMDLTAEEAALSEAQKVAQIREWLEISASLLNRKHEGLIELSDVDLENMRIESLELERAAGELKHAAR